MADYDFRYSSFDAAFFRFTHTEKGIGCSRCGQVIGEDWRGVWFSVVNPGRGLPTIREFCSKDCADGENE